MTQDPFNLQMILESMDHDYELFAELSEIFLGDLPSMLEAIRKAAEHNDPAALEQHAHKLKGPLATFSTGAAYGAVTALEGIGRGGQLADDRAVQRVADLERHVEILVDELTEAVRSM